MAVYPTSLSTNADLHLAVNNLSTVLTDNPLSAGATTVNVSSTTGFPPDGILTIDLEAILYTGTTGTSFTGCTRGFDGTTGASHPLNTTVFHDIPAAHHNVLKDEIIALETDLRSIFSADLDDSVAPAVSGADLKVRMDHFATQLKNITGEADWKTNPSETLVSLESSKAEDTNVVHLAGVETITGAKTFTAQMVLDSASNAFFDVDRAANTNEGLVRFLTAGTTSAGIGLDNDSTENLSFFTNNDFGTPKLTLNTTGNLLFSNGSATNPSQSFLNSTGLGGYRSASNQYSIATASTQRWSFDADGDFTSKNGSIMRNGNGSATFPAFGFETDAALGSYRIGTNIYGISTAGTERIRVDASGNVGFGSSTIQGNFTITDASSCEQFWVRTSGATLRVIAGATNAVLQTNSAHSLIFATNNGSAAITIDTAKNVSINNAALATNATDGFLYIPSVPGVPTGTATSKTGLVPLVYDTANNDLYAFSGGAWRLH